MKRFFILFLPFLLQANVTRATEQTICDSSQTEIIKGAVETAREGMQLAVTTLTDPDNDSIDLYAKWFGAPASDTVESVKGVYENALTYLDFQLYLCPNKSLPGDDWEPGDIAVSYTHLTLPTKA